MDLLDLFEHINTNEKATQFLRCSGNESAFTPPPLVPNTVYSLSNLRSTLGSVPPLSAPPVGIVTNNIGMAREGSNNHQFSVPPLSAPPVGIRCSNNNGIGMSHEGSNHQFFFGHDFSEMFEPLQDSATSLACSSISGIMDTFSANSSDGAKQVTNKDIPSEGKSDDLLLATEQLHTEFNNCFSLREARVRKLQPTHFSLKVFLGGIPAFMTTKVLELNFARFGRSIIDWPKKTTIHHEDRPPNGYAFVVFEEEESVFRMLRLSFVSNGRLFFNVYVLGLEQTQYPVEIKVWEMKDTTHVGLVGWRKFRRYSVFVGGIPRTCTAAMLAYGIQEAIGQVAYCAIELDRHHCYPKGAACVVFDSKETYVRAIAAHDVVLSFGTFERKVEFKPFLATNMPCEKCGSTSGTRFCAEMICLAYYCNNCWKYAHSSRPSLSAHIPSKRFVRGSSSSGSGGK